LIFSVFFEWDYRKLNISAIGRRQENPPVHDRPWPIVPENMICEGF